MLLPKVRCYIVIVLMILICSLFVMPVEAAESTGIIFIGDSRTVGMSKSIDAEDNVFFVAKVGQGYDWFCDTAINEVGDIISRNDYDNWVIVTNLGVNDLGNVEKYKAKYKELLDGEWKDYDFYITSIYCVDESKYQGAVTNEKIESFNSSMSWYRNFIDIYDISKREVISSDGLHFSAKCYQKLYQEILNRLED